MEDIQKSGQGHPMLRGGKKRYGYSHGFSKSQMRSLAVLCDTFIPLVSRENSFYRDAEVESFYLLCGSQNGIPDQVAEAMSNGVKAVGVTVAKLLLWLLATRVGTWILCGSASYKPQFPYLQAFADIPQSKRELIMLDWSQGKRFAFLKFAFKLFKICCVFTFYSVADENGQNPAWKSIGYSPPDLGAANAPRPLENGVIDLTSPAKDLGKLFKGTGFTVTEEERNCWKVECDAVVVGSGSGGGVAAAILAQAGYRVIVVEKGNYYARHDLTLLEGPSLEHMYESSGLLSSNDGKILIFAGSAVGGGSAINWSASIRTPPHVLNEWADPQQLDLPLFATEEYREAMKAVCERIGVQEHCKKESFQNSVLRKGCAALGYSVEDVPRNSTADHFCGSCCFGCPSGDKKGTDETWLVDAVRAGAVILAGCKAERVKFAAGKKKAAAAAGLVAAFGGGKGRIFVQSKVTVAACGSLLTPPLLRASGLSNPNIGRNLHLHPVQMAWGYFPESHEPEGKSYEGGIITAMCTERAGPRSGSGDGYGTIIQTPALAPGSFAAMIPWISGSDMKERMRKYGRTAHVFALVRDRGGGSVMGYKDIEYHVAETEKRKLGEALGRAVRILIAAGAAEVGTHRSDGQRFVVEGATREGIEQFVRQVEQGKGDRSLSTTTCSAHQMGSCRMGKDDVAGAVDWKGESWEIEGLFVCDASVLPTALGVNPMITVQSVALCVSKYVVQFLRKQSED